MTIWTLTFIWITFFSKIWKSIEQQFKTFTNLSWCRISSTQLKPGMILPVHHQAEYWYYRKKLIAIFLVAFSSHTNDKFESGRLLKVEGIYNLTVDTKTFLVLKSSKNTQSFPCVAYQTRHRSHVITPLMRRSKSQKCWRYRSIKLRLFKHGYPQSKN